MYLFLFFCTIYRVLLYHNYHLSLIVPLFIYQRLFSMRLQYFVVFLFCFQNIIVISPIRKSYIILIIIANLCVFYRYQIALASCNVFSYYRHVLITLSTFSLSIMAIASCITFCFVSLLPFFLLHLPNTILLALTSRCHSRRLCFIVIYNFLGNKVWSFTLVCVFCLHNFVFI